jgi:hypothetical protein
MYNFININGTRLTHLQAINSKINIVKPKDLEHFKDLVNAGYKVLIDAFNNKSIENNIYIDYIEENNIHIFIDALMEANVMKFHNVNINTEKTLLISNLELEFYGEMNNAILFPYFFVQCFAFWSGKENLSKDAVFKPLTIDEHLSANKKSCLCLNGVNRLSRQFVYDYFRDNNLIEDSTFSFHNKFSEEEWEEKYPKIVLSSDVNIKQKTLGFTWDNTFNNDWFKDTLFNLVTESDAHNEANRTSHAFFKNDNCFFPTEKVLKPIFNAHPFICIATQDFHKNLKKYFGFELYDEIWDYSFDDEPDELKRWLMVCEQAKDKIENGINYNLIKDKLIHNQSIFLNEETHKKLVSDFLLEIDKTHI